MYVRDCIMYLIFGKWEINDSVKLWSQSATYKWTTIYIHVENISKNTLETFYVTVISFSTIWFNRTQGKTVFKTVDIFAVH